VTRDLAAVTAGFASFLDRLPETLMETYDCAVAEPTGQQRDRLRRLSSMLDDSFVIASSDNACAKLLVGPESFDGGVTAVLGLGRAIDEFIPSCLCDACDVDSDSLIEQASELVQVAVEGFHEFRRPHVADPDELLFEGPWLEVGFDSVDGTSSSSSRAGHNVKGEEFSVKWRAWPRRT